MVTLFPWLLLILYTLLFEGLHLLPLWALLATSLYLLLTSFLITHGHYNIDWIFREFIYVYSLSRLLWHSSHSNFLVLLKSSFILKSCNKMVSQIILQLLPQFWCDKLWVVIYYLHINPLFFFHHHSHSTTSQLWQENCVIICGIRFFHSINLLSNFFLEALMILPQSKWMSLLSFSNPMSTNNKLEFALSFVLFIYVMPSNTRDISLLRSYVKATSYFMSCGFLEV